jgi:hypothetical protein
MADPDDVAADHGRDLNAMALEPGRAEASGHDSGSEGDAAGGSVWALAAGGGGTAVDVSVTPDALAPGPDRRSSAW